MQKNTLRQKGTGNESLPVDSIIVTASLSLIGAVFLYPTGIDLILDDDEYYDIPLKDVKEGDIVIYRGLVADTGKIEITHTGIVTWVERVPQLLEPEVWVLSKWGTGPEYVHQSKYGPYASDTITYKREGKDDTGF